MPWRRHPVVGALSPYPLAGCFSEFETATVAGLALVRGRRIDFLAVRVHEPGRGDGGRFLAECMAAYDTVGVWEVLNVEFADMLARRGFVPAEDVFDREFAKGVRWDRPKGA